MSALCFTADGFREGLTRNQATRQATLDFGGIASHKDSMRGSIGLRWWDEFWSDMRYGWRSLWSRPGFAAMATLALAIGIGAATTMFSVLYGVLIDPFPYKDADPDR